MYKFATMVFLLAGSILCLSSACAGDGPISAECRTHFAMEGNFLTGKKYSTWVELPAVAKKDAYSRVYMAIGKDGWTIGNADKDAGILSASQTVSYGRGAVAPLLIVVESSTMGSKITATFRTAGGQASKEETIRVKLCDYLAAASEPST